MAERPQLVVITGMSGAGRSQAGKALEDLGFFVIDNLPASLISQVVQQADLTGDPRRRRLAVAVDTRGGLSFDALEEVLIALETDGVPTTLLFLDADDEVLAKRFEESRRPHPVEAPTLGESIALERAALQDLRGRADVVVDTSDRTVADLRRALAEVFSGEQPRRPLRVAVTSFGFKHGVPRVIDLLFDVRFLPNPFWVPGLRPLTGHDEAVRRYVLAPARHRGLPGAGPGAARVPAAPLRGRGQDLPDDRGGLHRRPASLGGHRRGTGALAGGAERGGRGAPSGPGAMTTIDLMAAPLLEELEPPEAGPKVVAIGGGHGLAQALVGIRGYAAAVTAVVSVADDGGSSGRLAPALGIPPPGDCRRALLALSPDPSPWRDAMCHRFEAGDVAGHSLGNLLLAGLAAAEGGLEDGAGHAGAPPRRPGPGGAGGPGAPDPDGRGGRGPSGEARWPSPWGGAVSKSSGGGAGRGGGVGIGPGGAGRGRPGGDRPREPVHLAGGHPGRAGDGGGGERLAGAAWSTSAT